MVENKPYRLGNLMEPNLNRKQSYKEHIFHKYHLNFSRINLHALQKMAKEDLIALREVLKEKTTKQTCSRRPHGKRKL